MKRPYREPTLSRYWARAPVTRDGYTKMGWVRTYYRWSRYGGGMPYYGPLTYGALDQVDMAREHAKYDE